MGDKCDQVSSVSDSGVPESVPSASTVQAESPGSSPSASPSMGSLGQFTAIDKGVLGYSDSSQTSSATEKVSTEVEDDKWSPAAPTSTNQTAMVHPNQESSSRFEGKVRQNQTWKEQVPTLDSYSPTPAPPVSMEAPSSPPQNGEQASFTVGPPNAVPLEEENVESSSDMVVQKPEMLLTGDTKEDKRKIQNLEAKVEKLEKALEVTVKEKKEGQKKLEQAEEKIQQMETESATKQRNYEEEIKTLKERLASTEKEKSDQLAEYSKKVKDLNTQLEQLKKEHNNEKFRLMEEKCRLMQEKCQLKLTVSEMNTNEERLRRELAETNTKVVELQYQLKCQEQNEAHAKEVEVLRTQSANALAEKDSQLASALAEKEQQASKIEELERQLSFQTPGSPQGSIAE